MGIDTPAPVDVKGLPMPVRIALRDTYGKPDNHLTKSVASLSSDLGIEADLHVDWVAAWEGLKAPFKDEPQVFVPRLMDAAADLVTSIKHAAEDEEWGDKLLSELSRAGKNKLDLHLVVDQETKTPEPVWHPVDASITLRLPTRPATSNVYYTPGRITNAVQKIFSAGPGKDQAAEKVEQSIPITATKPAPRVVPVAPSKIDQPAPPPPERIPALASIPRPAALGESTLPYYATIFDRHGKIEVNGTHGPTIDLLADYMEKWAVPNPNVTTRAPYAKIERQMSPFGPGHIGVQVELKGNWGPLPSAVLPLQFLQGPMGYRVTRTDGHTWVLVRDVPFIS